MFKYLFGLLTFFILIKYFLKNKNKNKKQSNSIKKVVGIFIFIGLTIVIFFCLKYDIYSKILPIFEYIGGFFVELIANYPNGFLVFILIFFVSILFVFYFGIKFLSNKKAINMKRDISLATLGLFGGICGTIFWDTLKVLDSGEKNIGYYLIFLIFFGGLTIYLSKQIK